MERINVQSTNIASIGYDASTMTLEIEFLNGNVYQYLDVPQSVSDALMATQSYGQYLAEHIKGKYRYVRV
ncbi:KTSC domain-containing protein [Ohtaekwangia kribbensis]|uniref:KTSC domain-containing protein n=1 Tax=Ohtaekwangia kribbensis TaxID=688913 RepID=A0ABW3K2E3_9BACT